MAGSYYFPGGYSERDYIGLINAFRTLPVPLVVVCSSLNTELDGFSLPAHITILRDLPTGQFEACIRPAKAGIIALKRDTGAAGQSVLIRLLRNAKPVIASDFGAMRDYIDEGISGFLIRDLSLDLCEVITRLA
ncbi:MAG TPA: hypothetical protein VEV41_01595 [Terriglobales bacterium]|nr:hypothetical protein [Terriglobales bacterium]